MTSDATTRWSALGGVLGPAAFVGAWLIGGAVASHYSPVDDAISHLAQVGASTRVLTTVGFIAFGIGVTAFAVALRSTLTGWSWATATGAALATLAVAAAPLGRSSSGDTVHGIFASGGYVALALTPLLAAGPLRRAGHPAFARASLATGIASGVSLVATTAPGWHGLFQRIGLTVVDIWIITTAVAILRSRLPDRAARR